MKILFKVIFMVLVLVAGQAMAATCTSIKSGNWNTSSTWNCNKTPGSGDTVTILSGHNVTLNGDSSATSLTINAGGTLTDGGKDLTLSGNATINGTYDGSGNNGNLIMTGNGKTLSGTGTFIDIKRIQIDGNTTIPAGSNLNLTLDSQIRVGSGNAATLTINGTITGTAQSSGNDIIRLDNNNTSNVIINGTVNAPNSIVEVQAGGTVTNNGTVSISRIKDDNSTSIWTQGASSVLTFSGSPTADWNNGGRFNASANNNTVTYTADVTALTPSSNTYYNISHPRCAAVSGFTILGSSPCGPSVPTVTTDAATALTANGATLNGRVTSNGAITTVTFEYGLTTGYGATVTATPGSLAANATNTTVTTSITGLTCGTTYHFRANGVNSSGPTNGNDRTFVTSACPPAPAVVSINTASPNPSAANTVVSWTVIFSTSVTGVDASDFSFVSAGGVTGASVTSVTPSSGTTYTVTANTGTGTVGTLALKLVDNDSIINASGIPLGGTGTGNGDFTGQAYTLVVSVCISGMLFCDDFERSVATGGSNTAGALGNAPGYGAWTVGPLGNACDGVSGNRGCAGIDSSVPPWSTASSPRANPTRSMFTRWSNVTVTSPVIDLSTRTGAKLSFWLRRGSDCFSEWPGDNQAGCGDALSAYQSKIGEEFQVLYKNDVGNWVVLAQYPTDDTPGEYFSPAIGLPDDAMHATFQFRFVQPGGSGSDINGAGAPGVAGTDYWHVDNVILEEVPRVTFTGPFCDNFEGDLSRWDMAGTGNVRIGSTYFQSGGGSHNMDLRWNTVSATTKATDLTNSGNNIISFWVKRGVGNVPNIPNTTGSEYPETVAKGLSFDYLNNVNAWVTLSTFPGAGTQGQEFLPTAATNNFTIPAAAKHSGFKLRVTLLAGSGRSDQDYWHVDNICVGTTVGATDLSLTKTSSGTFSPGQYVNYTMTATNNGPNPDPGPITITDTLPSGLTYVGGNAGWTCPLPTGQSVVTCTQTGGLAVGVSTNLTLSATVNTGATGSITNTATVGGQTAEATPANNTATKTDNIFTPGYVFTNRLCTLGGGAVGTGSQCDTITWSPQTAGTPMGNIYITAVDASNVPIQLNATDPTTVNMEFGLSCGNPAVNAGVKATFYDATSTLLPLCTANGVTPTSWIARNLVFPAATPSVGPFSFNYNDVGMVNFFMRNSAVTTQTGQSGSFVVKPARFVIYGIKCTTTDAANCGTGALAMTPPGDNPAAATASGLSFIPAGRPFTATVMAVNAVGNATPNYGKETAPQSVKLTPTNAVAGMLAPAPAINGTFGSFASGVATGTAFTWGEVGITTLTPSVASGSYLGSGDVTGTTSGNVGRFYPDHFDTTVEAVAGVPMACPGLSCPTTNFNGMVYSGQPFNLTVTAKNTSGNPTINYNTTTGFAKTANLAAWGALGTTTAPSGAGSLAVVSVTAFANGTFTESAEKYTFSQTPTAPTNIYIRASDGEASSLRLTDPTTSSVEGGVTVVSGRIRIPNVYGSERLPLPLTATVQYHDGMYWVTSTTDSVTSFNTNLSPTGNLVATVRAGLGSGVVVISPGLAAVVAGVRMFTLAAPLVSGNVDLSLNAPSYLPNASARATFGIYKSPLIYRRENY